LEGIVSNSKLETNTANYKDYDSMQPVLGKTKAAAHLDGKESGKRRSRTYHWLRLAEMNSFLLEQSRSEISELKSRIPSEEIAELEQQVSREAQEPHRLALQKAPAEVRRQDLRSSGIAC